MAVTENLYTGDGSTVLYSFTFPYLATTDVKVSLDGSNTTAYTLANATQVQLNSAPASGVAIRVFRDTSDDSLSAEFFPGAAIKSADLNNNFTQNLYVTQESNDLAEKATSTANAAKTTADSATTTANGAVTTANAAAADATSAVSTANTASTNATNAVNTANTASTNATAAVSTANTASTNASTALSTANTANTNATAALNNSRESNGSGGYTSAITKANTAITTANAASSTANTASTNASSAVTTANAASATATAAQNAVNAVVLYDSVTNVSNIPGSPSDGDRIEVSDSTGIQSFSPLTGTPSGYVGSSQLAVRLHYTSSGSTWNWVDYRAPDPDARYFTKSAGDTNTTNIATKMPLAGGTFTGAVNFDDNVVIKGDSTNGSGKLTLNCENNSHGVNIKGPPHSAAATYTLTLPNNTGTNGQALLTNGSGVLSWGNVTTDLSGVLALTGGTMTGAITLAADPTAALHAATKQYVDSNAGSVTVDGGNFANGTSIVTTSSTIDGGSF